MIVYKLTSPSGKHYIGLTSQKFSTRWKQHVSLWLKLKRNGVTDYRGKQVTCLLFFAFDKYPPEEWTKEVIFEHADESVVRQHEIDMISQHKSTDSVYGYNVLTGGQQGHAGRKLDEDHKRRIAEARKRAWASEEGKKRRAQLSAEMQGHTINVGRVNGPLSEEHKAKVSKGNKGRKRSVEQCRQYSEAMKRKWAEGRYDNRQRKRAEPFDPALP
jgi:surface antigen